MLAHALRRAERAVTGHAPILEEVLEQLLAAPVPRPLFQLKAQAVDFFLEQPLRIDVAGH